MALEYSHFRGERFKQSLQPSVYLILDTAQSLPRLLH